jgi:hypothetical protein
MAYIYAKKVLRPHQTVTEPFKSKLIITLVCHHWQGRLTSGIGKTSCTDPNGVSDLTRRF